MTNCIMAVLVWLWFFMSFVSIVRSEPCYSRCEWTAWNAWSQCTVTCGGGYRERDRQLCCDVTLDIYECLDSCNRDSDGFRERQNCGGDCLNGALDVSYPTRCSCSSAYYGYCCQSRISCAQPGVIANGHVTTASEFYYGNTVTYSCDSGYNLTSGDSVRTCSRHSWLSSGYWTGSEPHCAYAISCVSEPCQNGGTCVNGLDLYTCICDYGWSGTNCEFDILPPVYDQCPDNITQYSASDPVMVTWQEPVFTDPHDESEVYISAQNYQEAEATLPWREYVMQYVATKPRNGLTTECAFATSLYPNPCVPLSPPTNGSLVCNGWNKRFTEICTLFCEDTNDVTPDVRIENVYVCGGSGHWLPIYPADTACSELRTPLAAANQTPAQHLHYYGGHCSEPSATRTIQEAFIEILRSHDLAYMCTADRFIDGCVPENVDIYCD